MIPPYVPATAIGGALLLSTRDDIDAPLAWSGPCEVQISESWYGATLCYRNTNDLGLRLTLRRDGSRVLVQSHEWDRLRLDARRPEVAHRIVDVVRAGERWAKHDRMMGVEVSAEAAERDIAENAPPSQWKRPPYDLSAFLPPALGGQARDADESAALLVASIEGIERGCGPVRGVLGERDPVLNTRPVIAAVDMKPGQPFLGTDEEALAAGFALRTEGGLLLPTFGGSNG